MSTAAIASTPAPPAEPATPVETGAAAEPTSIETSGSEGAGPSSEPPSGEGGESPVLDLSDETIQFVLEKHGGDPNKALRDWAELNNRAGEWRRGDSEFQQFKNSDEYRAFRQFQERMQRSDAPAEREDGRGTAPPQSGALPDFLEQRVVADLSMDPIAEQWRTEWRQHGSTIDKLNSKSDELYRDEGEFGQSGKIVDLDREIFGINLVLEKHEKFGLAVDEFQLKGLKDKLVDLTRERQQLFDQYKLWQDRIGQLDDRRKQLSADFDARADKYRDRYRQIYSDTQRQQSDQRVQQVEKTRFDSERQRAFPAALKAVGIPANDPKFVKQVWERVRRELMFQVDPNRPGSELIPDGKLQEAIEKILRDMQSFSGSFAAPGSAAYGDKKRGAFNGRGTVSPSRAAVGKPGPKEGDIKNLDEWAENWNKIEI